MEQEQAYLDKVMKLLNRQKEEWSQKLEEGKKKVVEIRKEMYEDSTKGIETWDDVYELNAMDALVCKYGREYGIDYENWNQLMTELDSPYFGRIDFLEEGEESEDVIYIGTYAIRDSKGFHFYVYDWRSPIASMYYDYELGDAEYEAPMGVIKGEITRKRQYKISRGVMRYWFDTDIDIQDELLARALSENTDGKLKVIVSSIQKEQNKVIRAMTGDVLYVSGPAGSGKTSVGLHRMAYLLYHNRGKLDARNIVIVANNEIFSSYISNILPDLGEEEAVMGIFFEYMKQYISSEYELHDFYEMIQSVMEVQTDSMDAEAQLRIQGISIKSSSEFLDELKQFMKEYPLQPMDLMYEQDVVMPAQEMERYLRTDFAEENVKVSISQVDEFIERTYNEYFENHSDRVQELYYQKTGEYILEDEVEVICYKEKMKTIAEAKRQFEEVNHLEVTELYLNLLKHYLKRKKEDLRIYDKTSQCIQSQQLFFEDATAILCLLVLLGKIEPDLHIKQVLVDEAQDFNVLQMYFLKCIYPRSKFTILADTNQILNTGFSTRSLTSFESIFSGSQQLYQLTKSYRSTAPINRLANQLLGAGQSIDYVERSGKTPQLICTNDFSSSLKDLIQKEQEEKHSVGILVYDKEQAEALYENLKAQMTIQLIDNAQAELEEEVVIMPLAFAKGLEFDCVIGAGDFLVSSSRWQNPNTLYLLCTRALHRLYFLSSVGVPAVFEPLRDYIEIVL